MIEIMIFKGAFKVEVDLNPIHSLDRSLRTDILLEVNTGSKYTSNWNMQGNYIIVILYISEMHNWIL